MYLSIFIIFFRCYFYFYVLSILIIFFRCYFYFYVLSILIIFFRCYFYFYFDVFKHIYYVLFILNVGMFICLLCLVSKSKISTMEDIKDVFYTNQPERHLKPCTLYTILE